MSVARWISGRNQPEIVDEVQRWYARRDLQTDIKHALKLTQFLLRFLLHSCFKFFIATNLLCFKSAQLL